MSKPVAAMGDEHLFLIIPIYLVIKHNSNTSLPPACPEKDTLMTTIAIVADIGGTNARFATVDLKQAPTVAGLQHLQKLHCADFPNIEQLIRAYLATLPANTEVGQFCICIAGAVDHDEIYMPNRHWTFSQQALVQALGLPIRFINDFTAQVHSVATLHASEIEWLGAARPQGNRTFAVIGPGTGLGVGAMTGKHEALASEGGHSSFSPQNLHQLQVLQTLWQQQSRVTVENVVSGPGLEHLYWANAKLQGREVTLTAPAISAAAMAGDSLATMAVQDFLDILAAFASDIAVLLCAVDGVYIVGDLHVQLRSLNNLEHFREGFNDKADYRAYCSRVPLALVTARDTGLRGCWRYLELTA
jgi:glucokinase